MNKIIYGSVCSGIEAASVAWEPLGWKAAFLSEIEKFPRAVLAHHYPHVPLHGDFTTIQKGQYATIDLLVGGTPCQSFSVAGLRAGLDDPRGNLMLEFGALAKRLGPRWLVWENVPGVLSSSRGRDFGTFLGMLAELGYGFAYRVLDAQFFGVAQRRRRVFVVGYLGDWRRAAAVLFERESMRRDTAPRRKQGKKVAPTIAGCANGGGANGPGRDVDSAESLICMSSGQANAEIRADGGAPSLTCLHEAPIAAYPTTVHTLRGEGFDASEDGTGRGTPLVPVAFHPTQDPISSTDGATHCIGAGSGGGCATVAVALQDVRAVNKAQNGRGWNDDGSAYTLDTHATQGVCAAMLVRRLTPVECERLQGFPDGYTAIPWRKKPASECPDGPRYKALGNSMAVPVMHWIGQRIAFVDAISASEVAV